jgi:hypothetical protein
MPRRCMSALAVVVRVVAAPVTYEEVKGAEGIKPDKEADDEDKGDDEDNGCAKELCRLPKAVVLEA